MSISDLPLIVLIHGAWNRPGCFHKLQPLLENEGYEVLCPALITSSGTRENSQASHLDDKVLLQKLLLPRFDEGREAIVVGHSYGGVSAVACSEGQTVEERAALGKKGGIRALVFLAALVPPVRGEILLPVLENSPWTEINGDWVGLNEGARFALYSGLPESEVDELMSKTVPMAIGAPKTPIDFVANDLKIPKTYVIAELDYGLPTAVQEAFCGGTPDMKTVRVQTGHSPFLEKPKEVCEIIITAVKESTAVEIA